METRSAFLFQIETYGLKNASLRIQREMKCYEQKNSNTNDNYRQGF